MSRLTASAISMPQATQMTLIRRAILFFTYSPDVFLAFQFVNMKRIIAVRSWFWLFFSV